MEEISPAQARRIALAAQGFADPRPAGRIDARHFDRVLDRIGLLQIDSVNVLSRSHYLPVLARLGPYPREALDRYSWGPGKGRALFEYWAHEASLIPWRVQPLLRWRMRRAAEGGWSTMRAALEKQPTLLDDVRRLIEDEGPVTAGQVEVDRPAKKAGEMWNWHDGKVALEWLFMTGEVTTATRKNFERSYDLPERVFPAQVLAAPDPDDDEAYRELMRMGARSHGIGTLFDFRDYWRLQQRGDPKRAEQALHELVDSGELLPVSVPGWTKQGYLWHEAKLPRWIRGRALLSPFDPVVWERDRALRLFGFHYRIEIYTPAQKRTYGYYVLPFLLGDQLVGRVDLKADRQAGVLRVQGAYAEGNAPESTVAYELAGALAEMAGWLDLAGGVEVAGRGDLAGPLAKALLSR